MHLLHLCQYCLNSQYQCHSGYEQKSLEKLPLVFLFLPQVSSSCGCACCGRCRCRRRRWARPPGESAGLGLARLDLHLKRNELEIALACGQAVGLDDRCMSHPTEILSPILLYSILLPVLSQSIQGHLARVISISVLKFHSILYKIGTTLLNLQQHRYMAATEKVFLPQIISRFPQSNCI